MNEKKPIISEKVMVESEPPEEIQPLKIAAPSGFGYASRIELDYIFGSSTHCLWAIVGGNAYARWLNAEEIKTIVQPVFTASKVKVQYNSSTGKIERIRPVKTF